MQKARWLVCVVGVTIGCGGSSPPSADSADDAMIDANGEETADEDAGVDAPPVDSSSDADDASDTGKSDAPGSAFRFAYVGCNRVQSKDATSTNPSTANLEQLQRTFAELATLDPKPQLFFMAGDMVLGLTNETDLKTQLEAWKTLWEASPAKAAGIQLVALPGNHESETKDASGNEVPYAAAETTWLAEMAPYIAGSNGPAAGGADGLTTDQSKLTYSFDRGGTHFVVLNTDPAGTAGGTVPVKWIAADVAAARAAGAKHLFAIGHKPAYPSPLVPTDGFSDTATRDAFWSALEGAHAEAMLAAHNHLWFDTQPHAGKTWQIVAGNGGSKLEKAVTSSTGGYYGFTVVDVGEKVTVTSYGRDVPTAGYLSPAPASSYPTTVRATVDVTVP